MPSGRGKAHRAIGARLGAGSTVTDDIAGAVRHCDRGSGLPSVMGSEGKEQGHCPAGAIAKGPSPLHLSPAAILASLSVKLPGTCLTLGRFCSTALLYTP